MTLTHRFALVACLATAPWMVACSGDPPGTGSPSTGTEASTALGRTIDKALGEAREKLATENIGIGGDTNLYIGGAKVRGRTPVDADGNPLPEAEISPNGDLLVGGSEVATTPEQRELLLEYRGHVVALVEAGMAMGVKGADLGIQAARDALGSVFRGETEEFGRRIEAEAAKLEAEAMRLCERLPAMLETQQRLAAALPEFRPYATMTAEDLEDCGSGSAAGQGRGDDPAAAATAP